MSHLTVECAADLNFLLSPNIVKFWSKCN